MLKQSLEFSVHAPYLTLESKIRNIIDVKSTISIKIFKNLEKFLITFKNRKECLQLIYSVFYDWVGWLSGGKKPDTGKDRGHEEKAGHRGWDGWMVSRTGKPGMLQSMGSQRVGHSLATEQQ